MKCRDFRPLVLHRRGHDLRLHSWGPTRSAEAPATMLDSPAFAANPLLDLRRKLLAKPPTLPAIFQTGDRVLAATAAISRPICRSSAWRCSAASGPTTSAARSPAASCAEGTAPVVYQAPFGAYIQEILNPTLPLHGFGPDLSVIAPTWRDLIGLCRSTPRPARWTPRWRPKSGCSPYPGTDWARRA